MKTSHVLMGLVLAGGIGLTGASGCSSDPAGTGGNGGEGNTSDGGAGPGPGPGPGSGGMGGTTTTVTDISTSCADAPQMEAAQNQLMEEIFVGTDVINPAQDKDFYLVSMTEGEWYTIVTNANPDDDPMNVDTVIRLYNPAGTLIATDDDAFPRVDTDSEMHFRAPETGTYCVEVLEFSDWVGDNAEGDPTFTYDVVVVPVQFDVYADYNLDTEPNDTSPGQVTSAADLTNGQKYTQLAGVLEPGTDTDWYIFTVPPNGIGFSLELTPAGVGDGSTTTSGFGSTKGPGLINFYQGTTLLAQVDNALQPAGLSGMSSVPITDGDFSIEVTRPDTTVGANDFYFLKIYSQDTLNPQEVDDANNGDEAGAEDNESAQANTDGSFSLFIGGTLSEGDVDYWTWPAGDPGAPSAGKELVVACSSRASGSGVAGFRVTVHNAGEFNSPLQQDVEDDAKGILWTNSAAPNATGPAITLANNDQVFVAVENLSANADGPAVSTHYLCGLHVQTP